MFLQDVFLQDVFLQDVLAGRHQATSAPQPCALSCQWDVTCPCQLKDKHHKCWVKVAEFTPQPLPLPLCGYGPGL